MRKMTHSEAGKLGSAKSAALSTERRLKREKEYYKNPKKCTYCEIDLPYKKRHLKFCNHSCSASFTNAGCVKNFVNGKHALKECFNCGEKTINGKYCSKECMAIDKWNASKLKIETEGKFEGKYSARRYIEEKIGNVCAICSREAIWEDKPLKLIVDHINGNAKDWSTSNIRLICPNCDSQTSTFKGRNMGNGRHFRRERYRNGLSY